MDAIFGDLAEPVLRLVAATLIGALVGVNRDLHGKPAGMRLCALVSLGSCLIVILTDASHLGRVDPTAAGHVVQGIVGGIGFLGAGIILHEAGRGGVRNLTTAAVIWMSAALGIACGLGAWRIGSCAAILALLVLTAGLKIDRALYGRLGSDDFTEPGREKTPGRSDRDPAGS